MKTYINGNTIANTVRMGVHSRRPKAIFLASDLTDIGLLNAMAAENKCRLIPSHSRENAAKAFEILVKDGWEGVLAIVNSKFATPTIEDILDQDVNPLIGVGIEGTWEEVQRSADMLTGQRVRVTVLDEPRQDISNGISPNTGMLQALAKIRDITKDMNTKQSSVDYLREARGGAMYGFDD